MATQVGSGMTTLKPDMKMMGDRVATSVEQPDRGREPQLRYAVSSGSEHNFRAVITHCPSLESQLSVALPADVQEALQVAEGDTVICVRI